MFINEIIKLVNLKLAGDMVPKAEMLPMMDEVIDEINNDLNACFPTFTEWEALHPGEEYTLFPENYLRTTVVYGTAFKFYTTDEEGIVSASEYQIKYEEHRFYMVRDYVNHVPEEYRKDPTGFYEAKEHLERGMFASPFLEDIF